MSSGNYGIEFEVDFKKGMSSYVFARVNMYCWFGFFIVNSPQ